MPCSYTDIKGDEAVQVETACPGDQNYNEPDFPPTPPGAVWIRGKDKPREYFAAILLREVAGGRQLPAMPPPPGQPFPFARIACSDKVETHQVNPPPADYLRRAVAEAYLGRLDWANAYASQGLALAPDDGRLKAIVQKTAAYASPQSRLFMAQDAFNNGHRAMEHGLTEESLRWYDRSIAVRPTPQTYFFRSQLHHHLHHEEFALQDAEAGLKLAPNDVTLQSAREQAQQALAAKPAAAAPIRTAKAHATGDFMGDLFSPAMLDGLRPGSCVYLEASADKPRFAPISCESGAPAAPAGMVYVKKRDKDRYRLAVLLKIHENGQPLPQYRMPTPDRDYPFSSLRCGDGGCAPENPDAEDYLERSAFEIKWGRPQWSYAYAYQGYGLAPDDPRLKALLGNASLAAGASALAVSFSSKDSLENAKRALDAGRSDEAFQWLTRSIAARPTPEALNARSRLYHAAGKDLQARQDAVDGLSISPGDPALREALATAGGTLEAQAAPGATVPGPAFTPPRALGSDPVALEPAKRAIYSPSMEDRPPLAVNGHSPYDAPAPEKGDLRPFLFVILALTAAGAGGGYRLAKMHARAEFEKRAVHATAPTVNMATIKDGTRNAPPTLRRYEVRQRIGAGGMGIVYEAYERNLGRRVAVKQMRSEIKDEERERAAFLKEAEIISGLKHPAIVEFREIVQEEGEIFLIFEFIEGKPLSKLLADKGRMRLNEAREVFSQVCSAVSCAHKMHVLHRDLKPANIMVDDHGRVKVMDFGIARQAKETITKLTRADASGTPAYMAPEQHLGSCAKPSDIYALGVCLYEALTGRLPFPGPDFLAQKERMHYASAKLLAPELPKEVDLLFKATLALKPEHRVADAEELIGSLRALST